MTPRHTGDTAPGLALDRIGRGLADPVHGAQQVYRAVLSAMSHPGRIHTLPAGVLAGLEAPGLGHAMAAVLLSLLDAETDVWLPAAWQAEGAGDWLRFHTGTRTGVALAAAPFAAASLATLQAEPLSPAMLWQQLPWGSDEVPQDGATLLLEVPALADLSSLASPAADDAVALILTGPGIADTQPLAASGLDAAFWRARSSMAAAYPRGVDLLLCCGDALVALPRSTRTRHAKD